MASAGSSRVKTPPHATRAKGGWARRPALLLVLVAAAAFALGYVGWQQAERFACRAQEQGTGVAWVGANCGYRLTPGPIEFRFSIDEGVERRLLLSGGTNAEPSQIRVLRGSSVIASGPTQLTSQTHSDVCRNQPPADARWWSGAIDNAAATAIASADFSNYRVEGLIGSEWRPLQLHASGCIWRGG